MRLLGKPLASFTSPDYVFFVGMSGGPVKPMSEHLVHQSSGAGMVTTLSLMNLQEQFLSFSWLDTPLQHLGYASLV
jgi:hypothetical protein